MSIQFRGVATTPADNDTYSTSPAVIVPVANMAAGDLCIIVAESRASSGTLSISEAGGQTWHSLAQWNQTTCRRKMFWCRFNGTWSASPSVTMGATTCNSLQMLVFIPTDPANYWDLDTGPTNSAVSAPGSPYTVTLTGYTPAHDNNVTVACWAAIAANTWGTLAGTGWNALSTTQFRNTAGSDQSSSFAYIIQGSKAAVPNVSQNESAGTAGAKTIVSFYEITDANIYFGYQTDPSAPTASAWDYGSADELAMSKSLLFTCPGSGQKQLKALKIWAYSLGGTPGRFVLGIYSNSSTAATLIAQGSALVTLSNTVAGWVGHTEFVDAAGNPIIPFLTGGTTYRLAVWYEASATSDSNFGLVSVSSGRWGWDTDDTYNGDMPSPYNPTTYLTDSSYDRLIIVGIQSPADLVPSENGQGQAMDTPTLEVVGGATDLVPQENAQAQGMDAAGTIVLNIAPAELSQAQGMDAAAISVNAIDLVPSELAQGQAVDAQALTQVHALAPSELAQAQAMDQPAISVAAIDLQPAENAQGQAIDPVTLTVAAIDLQPAESAQPQTIDQGSVVVQPIDLQPAEAAQGQAMDGAALTVAAIDLSAPELVQGQTIDAAALTVGGIDLVPADLSQGQEIDAAALSQIHVLSASEGSQAQGMDEQALAQVHALEPQENGQTQAIDDQSLTQIHALAPAEAAQGQEIDENALAQVHSLLPADLSQGQTIDVGTVVIPTGVDLVPQELSQGQAPDQPALTQVHALAAAGCAQGQEAAPEIDLSQVHVLIAAEARQDQAVDEGVALSQAQILTAEECRQLMGMDVPTLTLVYIIENVTTTRPMLVISKGSERTAAAAAVSAVPDSITLESRRPALAALTTARPTSTLRLTSRQMES